MLKALKTLFYERRLSDDPAQIGRAVDAAARCSFQDAGQGRMEDDADCSRGGRNSETQTTGG